MSHFQPLSGSVLLHSRGVFSEAKLFHHNNEVFARRGSGYLRLMTNNSTSNPLVFWSQIQIAKKTSAYMGRLTVSDAQLAIAA
jgi:hypothetical protein